MALEGTKEAVKWIMGIIAGLLLFSIKYSVDNSTSEYSELKNKVDKVYEYTTNHEIRMMLIEKQVDKHGEAILDLQLSRQRWGELGNTKNQSQISGKE